MKLYGKGLVVVLLFITAISLQVVPGSSVSFNSETRVSTQTDRVYSKDLSRTIYDAVSLQSYKNYIIKLTENGSRVAGSNNNDKAREWIVSELESVSNGRIYIEILGTHKSIVGRLPGWLGIDSPVLMVGGHYDSVSGAPGANDDGTGVAATLELARVMSQYNWPLDVYFCTWNAEEMGLLGSTEVAKVLSKRGIDLLQYYNVDMLLVEDTDAPIDEKILAVYNEAGSMYQSSHYWADLLRMIGNNLGTNYIIPTPSSDFGGWWRSDHASFLQEDYENVMFLFESGFDRDDAYHTEDDTWDNPLYNYNIATATVASIGASMAFTMGQGYGEKTVQSFEERISYVSPGSYYLAITTATTIDVDGLSDSNASFTLYSPWNELVEQKDVTGTREGLADIFDAEVDTLGLYRLEVSLEEGTAEVQVRCAYDSDVNGDSILDSEQYWMDQIFFLQDNDSDGLLDGLEIILGTSPNSSDSDNDTMPDLWEYENHLNPLTNDSQEDPDNDTLDNLREYIHNTDPNQNDTDSDLMSDAWEVYNGLNPLVDDANEDPDADGWVNLDEFRRGTDPHIPDGLSIPYGTVLTLIGLVSISVAFGILLFVRRHGI